MNANRQTLWVALVALVAAPTWQTPVRAEPPPDAPLRGPGRARELGERPRRPAPPPSAAEPARSQRPADMDQPDDGADGEAMPPRPMRPQANPEEREEIVQFVREHFPELARQLEAMRDFDNGGFNRRVLRILPRMRQLMLELRDDPETGRLNIEIEKLEFQIRALARQYDQAGGDAARNELRAKLRHALNQHFDLKQQRTEQQISRLERRIQQLRERMTMQQQHRDVLLDDRLSDLLSGLPARDLGDPSGKPEGPK